MELERIFKVIFGLMQFIYSDSFVFLVGESFDRRKTKRIENI